MKKNTYTHDEVKQILITAIVFANANGKNGMKDAQGETYGDKADHVIDCYLTEGSILAAVPKIGVKYTAENTYPAASYPESNIR